MGVTMPVGKWCDGEMCRISAPLFFERFGVYPLFIHRRETVLHTVALVHLRNFAVAGIFERVDLIEPQKLDEKPVEVLRSGADDDAVRVGIDAAKLPKVLGDGAP